MTLIGHLTCVDPEAASHGRDDRQAGSVVRGADLGDVDGGHGLGHAEAQPHHQPRDVEQGHGHGEHEHQVGQGEAEADTDDACPPSTNPIR